MEVENVWIRKIFDLQRRKRDGNGGKYLVSGEEKEMEKDDNIWRSEMVSPWRER